MNLYFVVLPDLPLNVLRDPSPFELSSLQNAVFDGWRRPKEIANLQNHNTSVYRATNIEPTMTSNNKIDLVQDMTSDCSVVASLCALVARAEQGHIKVNCFSTTEKPVLTERLAPLLSHVSI